MPQSQTLATDEVRGWVGREARYSAPDEVGRAGIRLFALAVGDLNPLYLDGEFARRARHGGIIAPPTLVCETVQYMTGERRETGYSGHEWPLPLPPCRVFRGSNVYDFFRPLRPDDRITAHWRLAEMEERESRSGRLLFVVSEVDYANQTGDPLARNRETMIHQLVTREAPERTAQAAPSQAAAAAGGSPGEELLALTKEVTTARLMTYGAATWDFHRYHYDADYARGVGLAAPFADGPMFGAFLAQLVMDWVGPSAFLRQLSLRYRSLVFPPETVTCEGRVKERRLEAGIPYAECELRVLGADGREVLAPASAVVELAPGTS